MKGHSSKLSETNKTMSESRSTGKLRGCIKSSKGPWVIHRTTKKGFVTSLRFPSEGERENNRKRESKRREMTRKIYAGLRAHGNYHLPKRADNNDLLRALCEEAGWHVEEDGTIYKKNVAKGSDGSYFGQTSTPSFVDNHGSIDNVGSNLAPMVGGQAAEFRRNQSLNLTLSLSLPNSSLEQR